MLLQENIPLEEVFDNLRCSRAGLTAEQAQQRLQIFGANKLEEKEESKVLKFLGFMWNPLSWVMEAAAIMAIALANGGVFLFFLPILLTALCTAYTNLQSKIGSFHILYVCRVYLCVCVIRPSGSST